MTSASDSTVMGADVTQALRERVEAGEVERVGDEPFVCILVLDSGSRLGLTIAADDAAEAEWSMVTDGVLSRFAPERAIRFVELIENPRSEIEEGIERSAGELGLPAESVLFSLPVVELVRAMLAKNRAHFSRQCLMWLLPSELRALRAEIEAMVDNELLPRQLRELAARLVVPQ
jgi:hypothetical protein